ncbi:MAG: RNA methyltransferase [Acetobacteraceae bacterium]|nr:RNA methyltransferase [Acetobacteraceae bacterium]
MRRTPPRPHHPPPPGHPHGQGDRPGAPPRRGPHPHAPSHREGGLWLYGLHPVAAALANPARRLRRLLLTPEAEAALAARLPPPWRVAPERAERARFATFLPEDAVHQGAALLADPLPPLPLDRALAHSEGPVLVLDQVTDPRNVGAILRSAAAFGAAALVLQDRHAPPETGALARAASGALEIVPVVREVNLARVLGELKQAGLWVVGLDAGGPVTLAQVVQELHGRRVALVLGAEGEGLRRLTRETCDELARLPIAPEMESLNVSAAAAVALYELARQ